MFNSITMIPSQFRFEIMVFSVSLEYSSPLSVRLSWKKDNTEVDTKKTIKYEPPGRKDIIFKEEIAMTVTLQKDKQTTEFQDKQTKLFMEVYTSKGYKPAGYLEINLKEYVNSKSYQNMELKMLKCADKSAKLRIGIKAKELLDENL